MGAWQGRKALIISAAPCEDLGYVRAFLRLHPDCMVLCADGGMKYAEMLNIIPDAVVADLDSGDYVIACKELIRLTPEKDDTDTQHCVSLAIERGCTDLTLVCATGGRLDHLLGNLFLCESAFGQGAVLTVLDAQNTVLFHGGGRMQFVREEARKYVSLIPLDHTLFGVTMIGVKYPLQDAVLTRANMISISNEAVEDSFSIEIGGGQALVIFSEDLQHQIYC